MKNRLLTFKCDLKESDRLRCPEKQNLNNPLNKFPSDLVLWSAHKRLNHNASLTAAEYLTLSCKIIFLFFAFANCKRKVVRRKHLLTPTRSLWQAICAEIYRCWDFRGCCFFLEKFMMSCRDLMGDTNIESVFKHWNRLRIYSFLNQADEQEKLIKKSSFSIKFYCFLKQLEKSW